MVLPVMMLDILIEKSQELQLLFFQLVFGGHLEVYL